MENDSREIQIKKIAIQNVLAYNKRIPRDYLMSITLKEVLCFMHPTDRAMLKKEYELEPRQNDRM